MAYGGGGCQRAELRRRDLRLRRSISAQRLYNSALTQIPGWRSRREPEGGDSPPPRAPPELSGAPTHVAPRIIFLTKRSARKVDPQCFWSTCA